MTALVCRGPTHGVRSLSLHKLLVSGKASIITTDEGPRSDDDIEIASVVLDNIEARQLAAVAEKAAHVREVLTGCRSGTPEMAEPDEPRPQYQPTVPMKQRYASKADEVGKNARTVERSVSDEIPDRGVTGAKQVNPHARSRFITHCASRCLPGWVLGNSHGLARAATGCAEIRLVVEVLSEHAGERFGHWVM